MTEPRLTWMPGQQVDLTNCDREPIHIPGAIQPHGWLFALRGDDLTIAQCSANVREVLGQEASAYLGKGLDAIVDEATAERLRTTITGRDEFSGVNPLRILLGGRTPCDAILHRSGGLVVLELEPATSLDGVTFQSFYHPAREALSRLQTATEVLELCAIAADEVRRLTGFDRVMVYRFDRDEHGHVVAEAKRDDLETYLDLHYPASDIPQQARRLYVVNWLRLIVDVAYRPVPVIPTDNPVTGQPLDLSHAVLRSVSPIHCEYLQNMGVHASMSVSLLRDGKLWGLVICHHYSPRFVPYEARAACEFLGQALSWQVAARERAEAFARRASVQTQLAQLGRALAEKAHPVAGLTSNPQALLTLVEADGAAVIFDGETHTVGKTPPNEYLDEIAQYVAPRFADGIFATESLSNGEPWAERFAHVASGVMAVSISQPAADMVMWFRAEQVQTVNWAGDPQKIVTLADGDPRLSPRGSFALWKETVRGKALPWLAWQLEAAGDLRLAVLGTVIERAGEIARLNGRLQRTTDELRHANHMKDEFLATVSHELRTPLNAMLGWLRMLRAGHLPVDQREQAVEIVERNAKVQAQLVEDLLDVSRIISGKLRLDVQPVDLPVVVQAAIDTVKPAVEAKRIKLNAMIDPQAGPIAGDAARLQQVVWNLLTNAVKFTPKDGRIQVYLRRNSSYAEVTVSDNGQGIDADFLPHLFERFRQADGGKARQHGGLGLGLSIVRQLVELHGGVVTAESDGKGAGSTFCVRLPLAPVRAMNSAPPAGHPAPEDVASDCPPQLVGLKVLAVDDEPDASSLLVVLLARCRMHVTAVNSAAEAMEALAREKFDAIVSDIGMPGTDGYAFMRAVRALPADAGGRTPAVALTAYARTEDRSRAFMAGFQAHIPKPIEPAELLAVLASLSNRISAH